MKKEDLGILVIVIPLLLAGLLNLFKGKELSEFNNAFYRPVVRLLPNRFVAFFNSEKSARISGYLFIIAALALLFVWIVLHW